MLQKIFETMIQPENYERSNLSYLNCRQVCSRWRSVMDNELEKNALSIWKTIMRPVSSIGLEAEPPNTGCIYVLKREDRFKPVEIVFLPPPLCVLSFREKGNPFPSKCLKLTAARVDDEDWEDPTRVLIPAWSKSSRTIGIIPFFSKVGEYLTSLILKAVTLTPETLIGILENTPNIKALSLIKVLLVVELDKINCAHLPALPDLHHVRLFLKRHYDPRYSYEFSSDLNRVYDWILAPYKKQLLTLDIYRQGGIAIEANFANLERLFVSHVVDPTFLEPTLFKYPRLKSLFLTKIQIRFEQNRMQWLKQHISPYAKTLSELHLDYHPTKPELQRGPWFQLSKKSVPKETSKVVFSKMKTLAISFLYFSEEVEAIKDLIKWFPNLEKLTFLVSSYTNAVAFEKIVNEAEFRKVCPKLDLIIARLI
ncbi:unnamed protein product [Orchesella dallaii]|uniref:F-box domain-containing protein n=1 Tax=Orchesella dallaii TaxID=48710 RepID=A0ABP1R130_9HEXA